VHTHLIPICRFFVISFQINRIEENGGYVVGTISEESE
jgi:hypothetical protein